MQVDYGREVSASWAGSSACQPHTKLQAFSWTIWQLWQWDLIFKSKRVWIAMMAQHNDTTWTDPNSKHIDISTVHVQWFNTVGCWLFKTLLQSKDGTILLGPDGQLWKLIVMHDSYMKVGWCNQITTICMIHMYDSTRIQRSVVLSRLIIQKLKAFCKTRFHVKNKKPKFSTKLKKISLCHDYGSLTFKTVLQFSSFISPIYEYKRIYIYNQNVQNK